MIECSLKNLVAMLFLVLYAFSANGTEIEVGFAPGDGAEQLALKVVNGARKTLNVAAYSLTLPSFTRALVAAKRRGVDVRVAVDEKMNAAHPDALNILVNAGVPVRTVSAWPLHHDKFVISDGENVQTGSFNYSSSATRSRENVLVVWKSVPLAVSYFEHWQGSWARGVDYRSSY